MPDKGHDALRSDLTGLLLETDAFQFHDFKNTKHAAPKVELERRLEQLRQNVMAGKYDN